MPPFLIKLFKNAVNSLISLKRGLYALMLAKYSLSLVSSTVGQMISDLHDVLSSQVIRDIVAGLPVFLDQRCKRPVFLFSQDLECFAAWCTQEIKQMHI